MNRTLVAAASLLTLFLGQPAAALDAVGVTDEAVEAALSAAGDHRVALAGFLADVALEADAERLAAARFLVADMPGKGYVSFELHDARGGRIEFAPLQARSFAEARARLDAIERVHGTVDFVRATMVPDLETISPAALGRHLDLAFAVWRSTPAARRVDLATFLDFVLPYRASEEPLEDCLTPLTRRLAPAAARLGESARYALSIRRHGAWMQVAEATPGPAAPLRFDALARDGLYWLVVDGSRRLECIFTIEDGRQRWW